MDANGLDSAVLADIYPPQQVEAYCDNSWSASVSSGVKGLSPMPFVYNLPRSLVTTPWSFFCSAWTTFISIPSFPSNVYHYIVGGETPREAACKLVIQERVEFFDKVDVLGRNLLGQAVADHSFETAKVFAIAGVDSKQRNFIQFSTVLHEIASNGDANAIELLDILLQRSRRVDVDAKDQNGMGPIHLAALFGQPRVLTSLMAANANSNLVDRDGRTPALLAAKNCSDCFDLLVRAGAQLNVRDSQKFAGIWHYAAGNPSSTPVMTMLQSKNIPINQLDSMGQTAMHHAAHLGNADAVDNLAYYGLSADAKDTSGLFPIHLAALGGHADVISRLAAWSANVNAVGPNGETALMLAAKAGHFNAVGALIANGAKVGVQNREKMTALNFATEKNDPEITQKLLFAGADVNHIPVNGKSALYDACKRGFDDVADILASQGGIVQAGEGIATQLNEAVAAGDFSKVQELILSGALLNARDYDDQTPLMIATIRESESMVQSLIRAGINENEKGMLYVLDSRDRQAIHFAAVGRNANILMALLKKGANHLVFDDQEQRPIHYAVVANNLENLRILAALKYDSQMGVDVEDKYKQTPLMLAALNGSREAVEILLENGASPDLVNSEGRSCLHIAAMAGDLPLLQLFLDKNAKGLNWADNNGNTPLYYAAQAGHNALADLLISEGATIYSDKYDALQLAVLKNKADKVSELLAENFPILRSVKDQTALHLGLRDGNSNVSQMLISHMNNSLIEYRDAEDNTPLILAAMYNRTDELKTLLSSKASPQASNAKGETALHLAAQNGNNEVVYNLALAGANLEAPLPNGLTPLTLAHIMGQESTCKLLADLGADPRKIINRTPKDESFALLNMVYSKNFQAVQDFLLSGANTAVKTQDGWTALHCAVIPSIPLEILESLVAAGLDMNVADKTGMTPLLLAATFQNVPAVNLILEKSAKIEESELRQLLLIAGEAEHDGLKKLIKGKLAK